MLYKFLSKNTISAFVLAPILVSVFWIRFYVVDIVHVTALDNPSMPLWDLFIMPLFGYSKYWAALVSMIITLLSAFSINRIILRFGLIQSQGMIPFSLFIIISSAFLSVQKLNPVWFFTLFFILAVERLFAAVMRKRPAVVCFDAAFLLGLGSLFYAKGIMFFPILIIAIGILRVATISSIVAAIMGFLFPFVASLAWFFFFDNGVWFLNELNENIMANPGQYNHNLYSQVYMGVIILLAAVSVLAVVRYMSTQKVVIRQYFRVFIWMFLIVGAALLTPFFSMELIPIASVAAAICISFWLSRMPKSWMKEAVLICLFCLTLAGQFFIN
jgi:hypothetical protein